MSHVSLAENKARFTAVSSSSAPSSNADSDRPDVVAKPIVRVYQCTLAGQRVFSDQPCAADAIARDIDVPNRMDAGEAHEGKVHERSHVARTVRQKSADASDSTENKKKRCTKISDDKERLTARMRAGYSGAQGERWRDRLRKLDSDTYELRCSKYR